MSPLLVYRTAAESMTFTYAAIAGWLVAHAVMEARQYPLSGLGAGPAPDLWFGYTPDRLNGYYGEIGEGGCRLYVRLANWDLFPTSLGLVGITPPEALDGIDIAPVSVRTVFLAGPRA